MLAYVPQSLADLASDGQRYLLSTVGWLRAIKKVKKTGHVPLCCRYLQHVLGWRGAYRVVRSCTDAGWLSCDHDYAPRRRAKGYAMAPALARELLVGVPYSDDTIPARCATLYRVRLLAALDNRPELVWMYENLAATSFRGGVRAVIAGHMATDMDRANRRVQVVGRLEDRDWWFTRDPDTGRVFHNVTTMPRDIRPYLLLDGQPVAETDIANCQPFLLAGLYPSACRERREYLDICVAGQFYEEIGKGLGGDREAVKVGVYKSILYGGYYSTDDPAFLGFAARFPRLGRIIKAQKVGKGGNSRLPIRMQRMESDLMLGVVLPRIMRELPASRALTIHDSLVVPVRHAEAAAAIIREELVNRYGVAPPVRVKRG